MNAFVGPMTGRYLERLADSLMAEGVSAGLLVLRSNGGLATTARGGRAAGDADALRPGSLRRLAS